MTLLFPSFLQRRLPASIALTVAALIGLGSSDVLAKMPNIKREAEVAIAFDLTATAAAPVGASGTGDIQLKETRSSERATLSLSVDGLGAGTYSVDALVNGSTTPVHIADITVDAAPAPAPTTPETGDDLLEDETEAELEITLPSTLDARSIATLTVSSVITDSTVTPPTTTTTVVLTGDAIAATSYLRFFANVRVTAPPASSLTTPPTPTEETSTEIENGKGKGKGKNKAKVKKAKKAKKIHGHALAKSNITNGVEKKRFFQFIGFGAPASATLNVVVNGETVGTVNSTKQGRVKFRSLPADIDFGGLDLVTITDANGVPVMQADF